MQEPKLQVNFVRPWQNGMGNSLFFFGYTDYGDTIQGTFIIFGYGYVIIYIKNPRNFR